MTNGDALLKQMYDANLASQKAALQSDYDAALADLDAQKAAAQKQTEHNVRLTKTEADRSAVTAAEYYEAAGLSSGAKAQAKVAAENQLLADLTAIRAAQQQGDINIERQRGLLGQQYAAAIREAHANNDMARAQALYQAAKEEDARLRENQKAVAEALAGIGDYSLYGQLYGLTPAQVQALETAYRNKNGSPQPEPTTPTEPTHPNEGSSDSAPGLPQTGGSYGGAIIGAVSGAMGAQNGITDGLPSATADSILALGGPLSPSTVAQMVANGEVIMDADANGNTIFRKKQPFATAANNWGRGW